MRIVIDCRCVFTGCGGIGRYTQSLVQALAAVNDYDEIILLRSEQRGSEPLVHQPNIREWSVPAAMLDWDFEQLQLPEVLRELGAELYHNPTFSLPVIRVCRQIATVHDVVFRDRPELVRPGLRSYLDRASQAASLAADRLITVSEYSKQRLCDVYAVPPARVDVIFGAAAASFLPRYGGAVEQQFRAAYGINGPFLLYVGSLEPKKNIDRLLQAFAAVLNRTALPHVLVLAGAGGGMDYDAAEAAETFGVANRTIITGYLPEEYLPYAYNAADAFIYPSLYEGFGLPPLEAMACGTPAIVSDTTSLPEVVGDAAVIIPAEDVAAMADAVEEVLCDPARRDALSACGLRRAEQFSWQATALQTLETYRLAVA